MNAYCTLCGESLIKYQDFLKRGACDCSEKDPWPHKRFLAGSQVETPWGSGQIIGIDLPYSKIWRWVVDLHTPDKEHKSYPRSYLSKLCFFDDEVTPL